MNYNIYQEMKHKFFTIPVSLFFAFFLFLTAQAQDAPPEWSVCGACHTIGKGRLVGPDLKGVNERHNETWLISFIRASQKMVKAGDKEAVKIFDEFKIPMPDNNLTDEQIKGILTYIKNYKEPVPKPEETKPAATGGETGGTTKTVVSSQQETYGPGNTKTTFYIFLVLLFISLIDLGLTKIIKAKFIHYIIILTALFVIGEIVYVEAAQLGRQQGYSPDQPVWFSHKVHAGQNQIDCLYCHNTAMDSKNAGIPGTDVCMNCHTVVKKGTQTGETEIGKVLASWKDKKPIEWIKVHNLPDHVFFSHAQHVNAGKRQCEECHGKVEEMDKVIQVNDLSMGWCIDCHRRTNVQFKDNDYYESFNKYHQEIKDGKRTGVTVEDIGGTDCSACHY